MKVISRGGHKDQKGGSGIPAKIGISGSYDPPLEIDFIRKGGEAPPVKVMTPPFITARLSQWTPHLTTDGMERSSGINPSTGSN